VTYWLAAAVLVIASLVIVTMVYIARRSGHADLEAVQAYEEGKRLRYNQHLPAEAIRFYNRAIDLNPKYTWAYFDRAMAYWDLHNYERAIPDLTQFMKLNPQDAVNGVCIRGRAYQMLGRCHEALPDLDECVSRWPDGKSAYYERSVCRAALGDAAGAEADQARVNN
jgi:tetratricopeptide (TPR) repeat protein